MHVSSMTKRWRLAMLLPNSKWSSLRRLLRQQLRASQVLKMYRIMRGARQPRHAPVSGAERTTQCGRRFTLAVRFFLYKMMSAGGYQTHPALRLPVFRKSLPEYVRRLLLAATRQRSRCGSQPSHRGDDELRADACSSPCRLHSTLADLFFFAIVRG